MIPTVDPELGPIHPGEVLLEEFLRPMGISQYGLAKSIGVDPRRIGEIVQGKRAVSADTAVRLGLFFGVEPQIWLHLQARHDLELTVRDHGEAVARQVHPWRNTGS
jgi:addiction module HigA family antidote